MNPCQTDGRSVMSTHLVVEDLRAHKGQQETGAYATFIVGPPPVYQHIIPWIWAGLAALVTWDGLWAWVLFG